MKSNFSEIEKLYLATNSMKGDELKRNLGAIAVMCKKHDIAIDAFIVSAAIYGWATLEILEDQWTLLERKETLLALFAGGVNMFYEHNRGTIMETIKNGLQK